MLEHFLDGNGSARNIQFSIYNEFPHDPGITRATKEKHSAAFPSDEPLSIQPLLHEFVYSHIQAAAGKTSDFNVGPIFLRGEDYYVPKGKQPRPYSTGFWAAFGHVVINGSLSASVHESCTYQGYFAEYSADYRIRDYYEWFPGKLTPFTFPFAPGTVWIPHEWELSLVNASPPRAHMYDFSISWTEQEYIFVRDDFSHFRELEWWEWESQFRSP